MHHATDQLGHVIMRKFTYVVALTAVLATTQSAHAVITASDNPSGPTTVTTYLGNENDGFSVVKDVSYDAAAGPWHKELNNNGNEIPSGTDVLIDERLTNAGPHAWTDWHEAILSITNISGSIVPGFLFRDGSLSVFRNGGILNQGSDYTLVPTVSTDPRNPGNWVALSIYFSPGEEIHPGDLLRITKHIFEVFGDSNTWVHGESALVAQYPTVPEPASIILGALEIAGLNLICLIRRGRDRRGR